VRGVCETASNGRIQTATYAEEALRGTLAGEEFAVAWINVTSEQVCAIRVGARHDQSGYAEHVRCAAGCYQLLDCFRGGDQYLPAEMATLLRGRKLIFKVYASGTGLDHAFHELECIESAAESGFRIGDDWGHPMDSVLALHVVNLVGAKKRVVNAADYIRNAVDGVRALVGSHMPRVVGVSRYLPAAKIDGLQSSLDLLHRLVTGKGAESWHVVCVVEQPPQTLRTQASQGVFHLDGAS